MAASSIATAAKSETTVVLNRGSADDCAIRAAIGCGFATASRGSADFTTPRMAAISVVGSPCVRTWTYIHGNGVWANGV
jgi:hypothetical protein